MAWKATLVILIIAQPLGLLLWFLDVIGPPDTPFIVTMMVMTWFYAIELLIKSTEN
jgi:hypothetical protein